MGSQQVEEFAEWLESEASRAAHHQRALRSAAERASTADQVLEFSAEELDARGRATAYRVARAEFLRRFKAPPKGARP